MSLKSPLVAKFNNLIFWAFLASFIYWIYLLFSSEMFVRYDSLSYEKLGKLIVEKGWAEYFRGGPFREPLYPFVIGISMKLSTFLPFSYYKILSFIQIMILGLSQWLAFLIMQKARVRRWIMGVTLLYMGFSPAIVNTAFSLYSEIMTFPFILGIILCAAHAWRKWDDSTFSDLALYAVGLGGLFLGATLAKGIYEYIFYVVVLFFLVVGLRGLLSGKKKFYLNCFCFLFVFVLSYSLPLNGYKYLNQKYNGIFTLTDTRSDFSLYASAARRTEPLTGRKMLSGIAFTAGEGACQTFFTKEECYYWGIFNYDSYGYVMLSQVSQRVPKEQVPAEMKRLALHKAMEKPFQFTLLMGLECIKMFFWESTKIGFVNYPAWLMQLYDWTPFKSSLRLLISLLSLLAFFYLGIYLFRNRQRLYSPNQPDLSGQLILFTLLIVSLHVGLYSLFMTIPRFSLPIAPLFLLLIAFAADRVLPADQKQ